MSLADLWPPGWFQGRRRSGKGCETWPQASTALLGVPRGPCVKDQSIQCVEDWTQVRPPLGGEGVCDI